MKYIDTMRILNLNYSSQKNTPLIRAKRVNRIVFRLDFLISVLTKRVGEALCRFKCEGAALSYIKISPQVYYQLNQNFRIDPNQVTISRKVMSIGHHMSENEKAY